MLEHIKNSTSHGIHKSGRKFVSRSNFDKESLSLKLGVNSRGSTKHSDNTQGKSTVVSIGSKRPNTSGTHASFNNTTHIH